MQFETGHLHAFRTWLRMHIPWFLIDLGIAHKGRDCESVGGWHRWYNIDDKHSGCYHCRIERKGRLWELPDD
jgi:hypothetical protein